MYFTRHKQLEVFPEELRSMPAAAGTTLGWFVWILAILLLISAGIGYRVAASQLKLSISTPIMLPIPLSSFPTEIGKWRGKDVPIPENIQRVTQNDDFLNRLYVHNTTNEWANVYVAYSARPRTMVGHRPEICYTGSGWIHDNTDKAEFTSSSGRDIPCRIHRFHLPAQNYEEKVVMSFYVVNGQVTGDESVFTGVGWRTPNIAGNPARYVAQVQISSAFENSVRTIAKDITGVIFDFLPDENGEVKATELKNTIGWIVR